MASPAAGPSAMATATARLSSTTGDGVSRCECRVQRGDPLPVGLLRRSRAGVTGRDGGLETVGPEPAAQRLGALERREAATDEQLVPPPPILVQQQHRLSRGSDAGAQAGRLDLHQGDEPVHFRLVRRELREDSTQAQGLLAERRPNPVLPGGGGVALVEDEIDHLEHRREPVASAPPGAAPRTALWPRPGSAWRARCAEPASPRARGTRGRSPGW